jgi:dynein heavy chain
MRMLFEVMDLKVASPATVSRCGMVYLPAEQLGWLPYFESWLLRIFPDESIINEEEKALIKDTFMATIDLGIEKIRTQLNELIITDDLQLAKSVFNFLEVYLRPVAGFTALDAKTRKKDIDCIMAFSFAWGLGASLDERSKDFFDTFIRDNFKSAQIPSGFTSFDYYYDLKKSKQWLPWDNQVQKFEYVQGMSFFDMMVPTADTYKHRYCLEQLLSVNKAVFFTGQTGVGKSVTILNAFQILSVVKEDSPVKSLMSININFSAQTDSKRVQQSIEEKLERSRTQFRAPPGKRVAIFIDDINMPAKEFYGAQPPIELLRLYIDKQGLYDRKTWEWKKILDCTMVAAAAPPIGGRAVLTPRFTTHFNMFCMPQATPQVLSKIFSSILDGFLKGNNFQEGALSCSMYIIDSTIEIYNKIQEDLKPTPAKFHYTFNLRDVSKVIQGIMMSHPKSVQTADHMQKLWVNEVQRVFCDRLINDTDRKWFTDLACDLLSRSFRSALEFNDVFGETKVMWSDMLSMNAASRLYQLNTDVPKLMKAITNYLEEFNLSSSIKMNLVFFEDAILHLLKIMRALRQTRGNIMLIGVGGSGK